MNELIAWKKKEHKLPLIILGARQVGKTYLIKEFADKHYEDYVYLNFELDGYLKDLFEENLRPERILSEIELIFDKKVDKENMLVVFDEIQISDKAITSLKYFAEEMPELDIICAGSLLGVALERENFSFPVGKVEFKYLYPFGFDEFIEGIGNGNLIEKIDLCYEKNEMMPAALHDKLIRIFKHYLCVGGMPAAINEYISKEMSLSGFDRSVHENIINAYIADMSKYASGSEAVKTQAIYKSIPEQLSGDSRKFKYSIVKKGAKASAFGNSIEWMLLSNLGIECSMIKRAEHPLRAYKEKGYFKIYLSDVGLLMTLAQMPFKTVMFDSEINLFKGAVVENYVAEHLRKENRDVFYWRNKMHEVDFIVSIDGDIIPIEVKSSANTRARSLKEYIRLNKPKYAIRMSAKNFGFKNGVKSVPLYAAYCISKITVQDTKF